MSWLPQRWWTQRNAIRLANCISSWIIKILNAHCAFGILLEAYLIECPHTPLILIYVRDGLWCCLADNANLHLNVLSLSMSLTDMNGTALVDGSCIRISSGWSDCCVSVIVIGHPWHVPQYCLSHVTDFALCYRRLDWLFALIDRGSVRHCLYQLDLNLSKITPWI